MTQIDTSADEMRRRVIRERKTEQRIRQMDAHEIVSEIHELEDENARLAAEISAREQAARREGMEEAAQLVDCGCDSREAVLARLESQGEKRASYLCPRGDVCCALQAASLRAAVKGGGDE
jgi:hypothetical protein